MNDSLIIDGLRQGGADAERMLTQIYRSFREPVTGFLRNMGADSEQARDIFQDSVIAVYENVRTGKFRGDSKLSTYLHSIARFMFLNRKKRAGIEERVTAELVLESVEPDHLPTMIAEEQQQLLEGLFEELGKGCRETLSLSIFYHYDMKEIAEKLSYSSEQIARNKKYRCLRKLKELIATHGPLSSWLLS